MKRFCCWRFIDEGGICVIKQGVSRIKLVAWWIPVRDQVKNAELLW